MSVDGLNFYEFMLLLKHGLSSEDCDNLVNNIASVIAESNGSLIKYKKMGIIPLAYQIKKRRKAMGVLIYMSVSNVGLEKLRGKIKYEDRSIRHIILKIDEVPKDFPEITGLRLQS